MRHIQFTIPVIHIAQEKLLPRAPLGSANANNWPHCCCNPTLRNLNNNANVSELMHWLAPRRIQQRSTAANAEFDAGRQKQQRTETRS